MRTTNRSTMPGEWAHVLQPLKEKYSQLGGSTETGVFVVMIIINRGCDFCWL